MVESFSTTIQITSSAFKEGETIPKKYSGQGGDNSPPLSWGPIPAGTKSFALINDDPDAPVGNWIHWLVKNIPPDVTNFDENSHVGDVVANSWDKKTYGGPMPPAGTGPKKDGTHRYFFKIYALNVEKLKATNNEAFYEEVEKHKIAEGSLMGIYKKI